MTAATRSGGAADVTGEDESYFVSMTDMLVGMLFVFIIILMAFALNLKSQETELAKTTDRLTEAQATRAQMLRDIRNTLLDRGVDVFIDERNGVLRLPERLLFRRGEFRIEDSGRLALDSLAAALALTLPCYASSPPTTTPISVACRARAAGSKPFTSRATRTTSHSPPAPRTELRATGTYRPLARLPSTTIYCALHLSSRRKTTP